MKKQGMNYKVFVTDEAINDMVDLIQYIRIQLCNPDAAHKLYCDLGREISGIGGFPLKFADSGIRYRGYVIHKKVYESYLLFYIINDEKQEVYVLRVLKNLVDWQNLLQRTKVYHLLNYPR